MRMNTVKPNRTRADRHGVAWHLGAAAALLGMLGSALAAQAGDRAFVLTNGQLDLVTAGGVSAIADGLSATSALGDTALADSLTSASVNPETGLSSATAFGVGADGALGIVDTSAGAADGTFLAQTGGTGDGFSLDGIPVFVTSTSTYATGGETGSTGTQAASSAPESFASGTALLAADDGTVSGTALSASTGVGTGGSGSTSDNGATIGLAGEGIQVTSFSGADGSVISSTEAAGTAGMTVAGIGIETGSTAGTASGESGTSTTTNIITVGSTGLIVRSTGTAVQGGTTFAEPSATTAITLDGVSSDASFSSLSRTTVRGGVARSLSIRILSR